MVSVWRKNITFHPNNMLTYVNNFLNLIKCASNLILDQLIKCTIYFQ